MTHLNKEKIDDVCKRLWATSGALNGLGALFEQATRDPCLDGDEFFGLGQLLKNLSQELSKLEDILHCGYDSRAKVHFEKAQKSDETSEINSDNRLKEVFEKLAILLKKPESEEFNSR